MSEIINKNNDVPRVMEVQCPQTSRTQKAILGDPVLKDDGFYYQNWIIVDMSEDEMRQVDLAEQVSARAAFKQQRQEKIDALTVVTVADGYCFDGDEKSQDRMSSAISTMNDGESIPWVLADNSVANATKEHLKDALRQAGLRMAQIWVGADE